MAFVSNPGFLAAAFIECSAAFILLVLYVLLAPAFPFRSVPGYSRRLLHGNFGVLRPRPEIEVPLAVRADCCHHGVPARQEILRHGDLGGVAPRVLAVHRGGPDSLAFPTPASRS